MIKQNFIFLTLIFLLFSTNLFALSPEKRLEDEKKEERAMNLFKEIKCLVCEAQSIESSNTAFSSGLREIIRQKIEKNLSDEEIKNQLKSEFGDQILMSSDSNFSLLIWISPFIFAILFGGFLFFKRP